MKKGCLIICGMCFLFGCSSPKFELLCEEYLKDVEKKKEIYLVEGLSGDVDQARASIQEFNNDLKDHEGHIDRVFIKDPGRTALGVIFNDDIIYRETKCEDIDIMDIYCTVSKTRYHWQSSDTITYHYHFPE